jgi:hypothetical protein
MDHALGIVERFVINHQARVGRAFEQTHQLAERNVALDRYDVGAMDHDIGDAALVQGKNVAQHRALDGGKADLVGGACIKHDLKVIAHRSWFPSEQCADRPHQPVIGRAHDFAFLDDGRQVARVARIVMDRF